MGRGWEVGRDLYSRRAWSPFRHSTASKLAGCAGRFLSLGRGFISRSLVLRPLGRVREVSMAGENRAKPSAGHELGRGGRGIWELIWGWVSLILDGLGLIGRGFNSPLSGFELLFHTRCS